MAMGGSYKGNSRGKSYGMILLLAFGAALLGVMVIHKLRERRIFNLLVKEKDRELISLHLLLQKEREYTKEMTRKTEEMKAKIYFVRTQKMESERRILELQSTIDSLRDEQKIMESALEEKQNEIKMHRETSIDPDKENPQMIVLMESLKQKESEIEDLKRRFENAHKIWSVSTDDPSNPQINLNMTTNLAHKDKTEISESKEKDEQLHESTNYKIGVNSPRDNAGDNESTTIIKMGIIDRRKMSREEQLKMLDNSLESLRNEGAVGKGTVDNGQGNKMGSSQDNGALDAGQENNIATANEGIVSTVGKVSQTGNADNNVRAADSEGHKVARDEQLGLTSFQQEDQDRGTFKGAVKLEMANNTRSSNSRVKAKHAKGKRWRILARNRMLENSKGSENNGAVGLRTKTFSPSDQEGLIDGEAAKSSNEGKTGSKRVMSGNDPLEVTNNGDFSNVKLLEPQNPDNSENLKSKPVIDGTSYHLEKVHGMSKRYHVSQDGQMLTHGQIRGSEESRNNRNMSIQNSAEQVNTASKDERPEEIQAQDIDRETDETTGDLFTESVSHLEEDKEEYKEESDESEF